MTFARYPILGWLTAHQHSTAAEIAAGTGIDGRTVAAVLRREHTVLADRDNGAAPWRYRVIKARRP
jgi:hypothetical protein